MKITKRKNYNNSFSVVVLSLAPFCLFCLMEELRQQGSQYSVSSEYGKVVLPSHKQTPAIWKERKKKTENFHCPY